ncbi:hypothetical protein P5V15_004500 [Pogonomyrmex californicus]
MSIADSAAANFFNIKTESKENIKIGWGTDITQNTLGHNLDTNKNNTDQWYSSTKGLTLENSKNTLQTSMNYSRNAAMDASIDKKSVTQPHDIHTQIHIYFVSAWKRVLRVFCEISKNWKMVREYIFIGSIAIIISIFCVLNLMYK